MRTLSRVASAGLLIAVLGLVGSAPAWACGDTPGFCPNPPTSDGPNGSDTGNILDE